MLSLEDRSSLIHDPVSGTVGVPLAAEGLEGQESVARKQACCQKRGLGA